MRAGILEGKENALNVEQSNFLAFDVDESSLARCDLVRACYFHEFAHARVLSANPQDGLMTVKASIARSQLWTLKHPCRAVAVRLANCAWLIWTKVP
jgi:hypothetical protein